LSGEKPKKLKFPEKPSPGAIQNIMDVAQKGNVPLVAHWLAKYGDAAVDVRDESNRTALIWAACNSRNGVMQLLLEKGADPDAEANNLMTPLIACIIQGNAEGITLLARHGADLERPGGGSTPVHQALGWMNPEIVVTLVRLGADMEARDKSGRTVIESAREGATKYGYDAILPYLLEESSRRAGEAAARDIQQGLSESVTPMKKIVLDAKRRFGH
jgi:ankyrin repeat protein